MPIYYPIFAGHGRSILSETLDTEDPFGLDPRVIVERVFAAGYTPVVGRPRSEPWTRPGTTTEIGEGEQTYLVTVGRDAETILVQEVRADGHGYEGE